MDGKRCLLGVLKSWECRKQGKFGIIKGFSHGCGYLKSPELATMEVLPITVDNLSDMALGFGCLLQWECLTIAAMARFNEDSPVEIGKKLIFVLFPAVASYVCVVVRYWLSVLELSNFSYESS